MPLARAASRLKGKEKEVPVFEVLRRRSPIRTRLRRSAGGRPDAMAEKSAAATAAAASSFSILGLLLRGRRACRSLWTSYTPRLAQPREPRARPEGDRSSTRPQPLASRSALYVRSLHSQIVAIARTLEVDAGRVPFAERVAPHPRGRRRSSATSRATSQASRLPERRRRRRASARARGPRPAGARARRSSCRRASCAASSGKPMISRAGRLGRRSRSR